jgi:PASTA domain/Putative Ig domain
MAGPIGVPDLVGLTQSAAEAKLRDAGLVVGIVTKVGNATVPTGSVSNAKPTVGTPVSSGSTVDLEISTGSPQVAVPNVIGLTRLAAEAKLKDAGLVVGAVKTEHSKSVPTDGISDTDPDPGTLVSPGSEIKLYISTGPGIDWLQKLPPVLFSILGIFILLLIAFIIIFDNGHEFLLTLADKRVARGLITFLIAIATVGIAMILAISTVILTEGAEGDKRFDRGKQVLSVLIGVLGTIVGFYFGSATDSATPPIGQVRSVSKITTAMLPDGAASQPYPSTALQSTGLKPPLTWSVMPALPLGLTLDAMTGTINGTPTAVLSKTQFTFTVTDSANPTGSSTSILTLEIK